MVLRLLLALSLISLSTGVLADQQPEFDSEIQSAGQTLKLCSTTKVKAYSMILVGYSALYMEDCDSRGDDFFEKNKVLSFYYLRDVPKHAFQKSTLKFLQKNLSKETMVQLEPEIVHFNESYQDVGKDDQYKICFSSGEGLKLYLNDEVISSNGNDELAKLYFNVWFGEKPFNKSMKKQLLKS